MLCPLDAALLDHSRVPLRTSPAVGIRFWEFGLLLAGGVVAIVLSDLLEFVMTDELTALREELGL